MSAIGSIRNRAASLLESSGIARFRTIMSARECSTVARQTGCAPQRQPRLTPEVVAWLMMLVALHTESMTQGLIRVWGWVSHLCPASKQGCVTEEAFCQARSDLPLAFWRTLWGRLTRRYEQQFAPQMLWKGLLRVLAVDGSEVNLPTWPALVRFFTCPKNDKGRSRQPQGRLVALCSVFTGFCLAFKFVSLRFTEHRALQHLIRYLRFNDLILLDRGFFSLPGSLENPATGSSLPHADLEPGRRIRQAIPTPWTRRLDGPVPSLSLQSTQMPRAAF